MPNAFERFFESVMERIPSEDESDLSNLWSPEEPGLWNWINVETPSGPCDESLFDPTTQDGIVEIDEDDRQLIDGGLRVIGMDVLAFYKSRRFLGHHPIPGKWGIFYLKQGITRIAKLIDETYPGLGSARKLAYQFLREHEHYHYRFDVYVMSLEAAMVRRLYEPLKRSFRSRRTEQVEEALANKAAFKWATKGTNSIHDFAREFMKLQPGQYARFDEDEESLTGNLAANLFDKDYSVGAFRRDQSFWIAEVPAELRRKPLCPEWWFRPHTLSNLIDLALRLPIVREVIESAEVASLLKSRYITLRDRWETTKRKLTQSPRLPGLNFKPWDKRTGLWSVRVTDNFRAHLKLDSADSGRWIATEIGGHTAIGHG